MYGRGAGDMKAGIVSYVTAFRALKEAGLQPAAEVQMQSVIEEECTGNGALACMTALPKADAAIIPEPGPACRRSTRPRSAWSGPSSPSPAVPLTFATSRPALTPWKQPWPSGPASRTTKAR
jgi:hypothetical protein